MFPVRPLPRPAPGLFDAGPLDRPRLRAWPSRPGWALVVLLLHLMVLQAWQGAPPLPLRPGDERRGPLHTGAADGQPGDRRPAAALYVRLWPAAEAAADSSGGLAESEAAHRADAIRAPDRGAAGPGDALRPSMPAAGAAGAARASAPGPVRAPATAPDPVPALVPALVSAPGSTAVTAPITAPTTSPAWADPDEPAQAPSDGEPPPLYAVHWPPPARLLLQVEHLGRRLPGELVWQIDGRRYALGLRFGAADGPRAAQGPAWHSRGELSADGLVPERLLDERPRRGAQAANFEPAQGRVRFSGGRGEAPIWPGTQDRLGWLVQLAGIAEAAARTGQPLTEIRLHVVDARGGRSSWRLHDQGDALIDTPLGPLRTRHWRHAPATPEGMQVDVWLDPARHHWPVQVQHTLPRSGALIRWRLAAEPAAPAAHEPHQPHEPQQPDQPQQPPAPREPR